MYSCGTLPMAKQRQGDQLEHTYLCICVDTGCSPEDLLEAMDDWEGWRERVRDIHADGATWGWWWYQVNNDREYPKKEWSMHGYLI